MARSNLAQCDKYAFFLECGCGCGKLSRALKPDEYIQRLENIVWVSKESCLKKMKETDITEKIEWLDGFLIKISDF